LPSSCAFAARRQCGHTHLRSEVKPETGAADGIANAITRLADKSAVIGVKIDQETCRPDGSILDLIVFRERVPFARGAHSVLSLIEGIARVQY